ncbi:MAG: hypothetical protein R2855_09815 [Thermomicrobiales bacterium]
MTYSGVAGYISADYLTFDEPTTPGTPGGLLIWPVSGVADRSSRDTTGHAQRSDLHVLFDPQRTLMERQATIGQPAWRPGLRHRALDQRLGLLIGMGNGYGIALFHITLSTITSGTVVTCRGQQVGTDWSGR